MSMVARAPWDRVVLRVHYWMGPEPQEGDALLTSTGRRYLILEARRARNQGRRLLALECVVLDAGAKIEGTVFQWTWEKRKPRPPLAGP